MSQRINLYRDDLRPFEARGELRRLLAVLAAVLVLLLVWGGWTQWRAAEALAARDALHAEQADLQSRSEAASQALARRLPDPELTRALVEAQQAVDGRRWIEARLREAGTSVVPFDGVLAGLGRQRPEPLWLTRIHLADAGARLGLGGHTLDAEAVPAFLQALSTEPALAGRRFSRFEMGRGEQAGAPLRFELATDCEALAKGCDGDASGAAP